MKIFLVFSGGTDQQHQGTWSIPFWVHTSLCRLCRCAHATRICAADGGGARVHPRCWTTQYKNGKTCWGSLWEKKWRLLTVKIQPTEWGGMWGSHAVKSYLKAEGNTIAATWFETMWQRWKWLTSPHPLLFSAFICDLRSIPSKHFPPMSQSHRLFIHLSDRYQMSLYQMMYSLLNFSF